MDSGYAMLLVSFKTTNHGSQLQKTTNPQSSELNKSHDSLLSWPNLRLKESSSSMATGTSIKEWLLGAPHVGVRVGLLRLDALLFLGVGCFLGLEGGL